MNTTEAAWGTISLVTAAELLSSTWRGWAPTLTPRLVTVLETYIEPNLFAFWANYGDGGPTHNRNNRFATMAHAWFLIGALKDDADQVEEAIAEHRRTIGGKAVGGGSDALFAHGPDPTFPAADSVLIAPPPSGLSSYCGVSMEVCRDDWHPQVALHSAVATAESAWHQGWDLYAYLDSLLLDAAEQLAHAVRLGRAGQQVEFTVYQTNGTRGDYDRVVYPFHGRAPTRVPLPPASLARSSGKKSQCGVNNPPVGTPCIESFNLVTGGYEIRSLPLHETEGPSDAGGCSAPRNNPPPRLKLLPAPGYDYARRVAPEKDGSRPLLFSYYRRQGPVVGHDLVSRPNASASSPI